jgi:DNA topoisomerase-1
MSESEEEEFTMEDETPVKASSKRSKAAEDEDFMASSPERKPKKRPKPERTLEKKKKKKKIVITRPDPAPSSSAVAAKKKKKRKQPAPADHDGKKAGSPKKPKAEPRQLKKLDKTERLQYAMQSFLWWEAPILAEGINWTTMEHSGVAFPEEYAPHGVKMLYEGHAVVLTPEQEEAATFFAAMDPDGMHLGNPKTAPIFIKNFFADFCQVLGKKHVVKDFKKCDFGPIRKHLNEQKLIGKAISDKERAANK